MIPDVGDTTLAYDVETTGLDAWNGARIFAYSTTSWEGSTDVRRSEDRGFLSRLRNLFSGGPPLCMHNARFDLRMTGKLLRRPVWWEIPWVDTMVLSHLLMNHHYSHSLEDLCWDLFKYPKIDAKVHLRAKQLGGMHKVPIEEMSEYQKADTERTMLLLRLFWPKMMGNKKLRRCYELECDVIKVTLDMEERGVHLDRLETRKLRRELEKTVWSCRQKLGEDVWPGFNPKSVLDMRKLLYEQWGLEVEKTTKQGSPSIDKHVLMKIREEEGYPGRVEVVNTILRHNSAQVGVATLSGYLRTAHQDGTIHPNLNTLGATTGRQSSSNPNLQNVSKEGVLLNPYPIPARRCFSPRVGFVNLHIDFSGIEMRLLVEYSGEPEMVACIQEGGDVHGLAAETFYQGAYRDSSGPRRATLRGAGKNANFACPYGAGRDKVVQTLGLDPRSGEEAYTRYRDRFKRLTGLTELISKGVKEKGHVVTRFGRKLHVPKNKAYMGTNYIIQGTAAEILKHAQVRVHRLHQRAMYHGVSLLLTIHDEVVIEYPIEKLPRLQRYLREVRSEMTRFPEFKVPLEVEVSIATERWDRKRVIEVKQCN